MNDDTSDAPAMDLDESVVEVQENLEDVITDFHGKLDEMYQTMAEFKVKLTDNVRMSAVAMSKIHDDFKDYEEQTLLHVQQLRDMRGRCVEDADEQTPNRIEVLDKLIAEVKSTVEDMRIERNTVMDEFKGICNTIQKVAVDHEGK